MDYEKDIPRYKKKSNKKAPTKADHKHEYVNCVFEIGSLSYDNAHGFIPCSKLSIGTYCNICGKIGTKHDNSWDTITRRNIGISVDWSPRALAEFDESTRTLPFFCIKDIFKQKYVEI